MKRNKIFGVLLLLISFLFIINVKAESKNEVTLNFKGGIIHDGYVEYSKIGKVQLFKGDELVTNISNNMIIDLNEADYEFVIQEIPAEDTGSVVGPAPVKLNINDWYYATTTLNSKVIFKLESSKFSGTLDVKLVRTRTVVNTTVKNVYNDISSKGVIDLTGGQEYVIDFSKDDELTNGLKSFADLDKTLYYKRDNEGLLATDNESEAVIKIVGNKSENKAMLTAVNVGTKKSEVFKGFHTKYTGSALNYDGTEGGIINETRTDYYTRCTYDFTFKYVDETEEKDIPKEIIYKFLEGENQKYIINQSDNARFRIDADYSLFQNGGKLYIDDILVDTNNYTSESGSTIITLKKDYVSKLGVGEHKLKVVFNDGGVAESKFTIGEAKNEVKETIKNPQTGDSITTYIILSIISVVGIVVAIIINKKKKES